MSVGTSPTSTGPCGARLPLSGGGFWGGYWGLGLVLLLSACPQPPPAAPTVALVMPGRSGVTTARGAAREPVLRPRRIEAGTEVRAQEARASLFTDSGAWALLDQGGAARFEEGAVDLVEGRLWIDARGGDPLRVRAAGGQLTLTAQGAGLSVSADQGGVQVYCAAGQVTWQAGQQGGRLESGLSLIFKDGQGRETAQALWDDWTLGLAEPGPLRPLMPAGVGQLAARRADEIGQARTPLIVRRHEVRVRIVADQAFTEVEQTFFNPRSEIVEGAYTVRLPEAAILADFAVGDEDSGAAAAQLLPRARENEAALGRPAAQLEWAGAGRYRGLVQNILPGKTKVLRLRYSEWLPHVAHPGGPRRSYVYPMGQSAGSTAGAAPSLGEFALEVDVGGAGAGALEAGLGAKVEGGKVILRRSDFRPRADFVLDILDSKEDRPRGLVAFRGAPAGDGARYLFAQPVLDPGPQRPGLDLVLVLDVSAATDPARLDLGRATAQAFLRQLRPADRVALLAASLTAPALGQEALAPATPERVAELLDALARQTPGGATDLGLALSRAVGLLPPGHGSVVYIGDGKPTAGALLPGEIREHLLRLSPLPRLYAVAVGSDAHSELLAALCDSGRGTAGTASGVLRVEDRPEAARAALHLLTRAAQPALTGVSVSFPGEDADVVYPEAEVTLEGGEPLPIVARLRPDKGQRPPKLVVRGHRDGQPFTEELALALRDVEDEGDLARRWAQARLLRLLERGAGREAALDIGLRYGVVTPWTALVLGGDRARGYGQLLGEEEHGTFVPPALRGQAPPDSPLALEPGTSTRSLRPLGIEALYERALQEKQAPARVCYERKAAGHPELSGRVALRVKIGLDGAVLAVKPVSSTLRSRDVEACIERAVAGLRLPPSPDGKPHEVSFALQLEAPTGGGPRSCSAASRAYLAVRRALWRERLGRVDASAAGAMNAWREAEARCELRTWLDRRALLDLLRPFAGGIAQQIDLYHRFDGADDEDEIHEYLRREILRALRTQEDVQLAAAGLALDGGVDPGLVAPQLAKAKSAGQKIAVLRQFLALSPRALALKVQLLGLLEQAGQKAEARRLAESLRADAGADAAVRQALGEFLLRGGDAAEGARALSEIVEFAPFDPWGRRRLGDLYRAHRFPDAAYREYQVLGWLLPQDESVHLLLADAAAAAGRTDEALRLLSRVSEAVGARPEKNGPAAWARVLQSVLLARLRQEARQRGDKNLLGDLLARGRSDGAGGEAGNSRLLVALTWAHPDAQLRLFLVPPGQRDPERAGVQGAVGLEAQRYERIEPGEWQIVVSRPGSGGHYEGELLVLQDEAHSGEIVRRARVAFAPGDTELRFRYADGQLK